MDWRSADLKALCWTTVAPLAEVLVAAVNGLSLNDACESEMSSYLSIDADKL